MYLANCGGGDSRPDIFGLGVERDIGLVGSSRTHSCYRLCNEIRAAIFKAARRDFHQQDRFYSVLSGIVAAFDKLILLLK